MLVEFKFLADRLPADKQLQDWYRSYEKTYDFGKAL
jgi:hypothetical protein